MCGRYSLRRVDIGAAALEATPSFDFEEFSEQARFNVAPSQIIPLARINSRGQRVLDLARWGLIPAWCKTIPKLQPINARAETLATSGMFRNVFERRRCLIPTDGFYEWKPIGKKTKQPYFIHFKDDRIFAFAGLWDIWRADDETEPIETCTIITTSPNDLVKPIHNRMPAIVDAKDYARWLDPHIAGSAVADVLRPFPADAMEAVPVSTRVNSAASEGPALIEPATIEKVEKPEEPTLF
jgi:putative SOS response-associated peptidase YedK